MNSAKIKAMTDDQLIERVGYLVRRERELVECLIWHLQEIQDRKLFIQMGFTSLFECLVKHFKYSEAVAYSRISALKIISAVPEAAEALSSGEVNLTTLSLTQSFIRKQEKETGEKVSPEQKIQYLETIKNKSTQEVKQILAAIHPAQELPLDKIQYLDKDHAQLQATIELAILEKIEKLKSLISHENLDPSFNEIFDLSLDAAIEKYEKKKGIRIPIKKNLSEQENRESEIAADIKLNEGRDNEAEIESAEVRRASLVPMEIRGNNETSTQSFSVKSSRYISREVKRFVLHRSNNQCEYIHSNG